MFKNLLFVQVNFSRKDSNHSTKIVVQQIVLIAPKLISLSFFMEPQKVICMWIVKINDHNLHVWDVNSEALEQFFHHKWQHCLDHTYDKIQWWMAYPLQSLILSIQTKWLPPSELFLWKTWIFLKKQDIGEGVSLVVHLCVLHPLNPHPSPPPEIPR